MITVTCEAAGQAAGHSRPASQPANRPARQPATRTIMEKLKSWKNGTWRLEAVQGLKIEDCSPYVNVCVVILNFQFHFVNLTLKLKTENWRVAHYNMRGSLPASGPAGQPAGRPTAHPPSQPAPPAGQASRADRQPSSVATSPACPLKEIPHVADGTKTEQKQYTDIHKNVFFEFVYWMFDQ